MTPDDIISSVLKRFSGAVEIASWGERSVFHNPGRALPRGTYFLTIKQHDGPNDRASQLDRKGVFRVNFSVDKPSYERLFGPKPARPSQGGVVNTGHDFTLLNELTPHPTYAWMGWLSVLNPSIETFEELQPLIEESHQRAVAKFEKRIKQNA